MAKEKAGSHWAAAGAAGWPSCLFPFGRKMSKSRSLPCSVPASLILFPSGPRGWACVVLGQPVDPTPSLFGSHNILQLLALPLPASKGAEVLRPETEVARGSMGGMGPEKGRAGCWGGHTYALSQGARRGPLGELLSTALPATPGMNYFGHTSQQKAPAAALPGMTASHCPSWPPSGQSFQPQLR